MSYNEAFSRFSTKFGIEGAHPPPGVNGAAIVELSPSGGYT